MSPARRSVRRRDWPRGLYEPRAGYFIWRHPDGRTFPIGRVPLVAAKSEAISANHHVADTAPSLVDRITGATHTVSDLLARMPVSPKRNTAASARVLDRKIAATIGEKACGQVTVSDCADLIQSEIEAGHDRQAQALRSRMRTVFRRGVALGWLEVNPADVTENPVAKVRRGRLTLESFQAIYAKAAEVSEWLQHAMALAIVTGADRTTIAGLQRSDVADGFLTITRSKTGARIAIPLALRLDCVGWSLAELVARRTGVISKHLVHHVNSWGNAPAGSQIFEDRITKAFTEARKRAGIPDDCAPTFHEIRSLSKRLYEAQGNVDTKALLGHATERMSDLYADPRGVEPIRVRIG